MSDTTRVAEWPGLHPGTGLRDHLHYWRDYQVAGRVIRACQICGWPHPDDATIAETA